jgi:hypothetical protein
MRHRLEEPRSRRHERPPFRAPFESAFLVRITACPTTAQEKPFVTADPNPRYGRVHFNPGWFLNLLSLLFLTVSISIALRPEKPEFAVVMGWISGITVILTNIQVILRIPAVETDDEGITLRPTLGWGRVFVKWEDVEGVVLWYDHTDGNRSTMIAVATAEGFQYDNYGRYRQITVTRNPASSRVKRRFRSWSVNTGATSARKVVRLVNASGKGVPVSEELPNGDIRNHTGPQ